MVRAGLARLALKKSRFFLERARQALGGNFDEIEPLFEATVVFGRHVTFYLQKEFSTRDGFKVWYESEARPRMRADPLLTFFNERRVMILHVGPLGLQRIIEITARDAVLVTDHGIVMVPEPSRIPWPWRDRTRETLRRLRVRLWRWQARLRSTSSGSSVGLTRVDVVPTLYFTDAEWRGRSALELAAEYLDRLEAIVAEAEMRVR